MMDPSQFASMELRSSPTRDRSELVSKAVQHFDGKLHSANLNQAMSETVDIAVRLGLTDEECHAVYRHSDMQSGSFDGFLKGVQRKRRIGASPEKLVEMDRQAARQKEESLRPKVSQWFLETKHDMQWDDVIGNEDARAALIEAIEYPVTHSELFRHYGRRAPKGILLWGPPGCGKTMFGKVAASVLARLHGKDAGEHTMLAVNAPALQRKEVGVTQQIIRDIFAYARAYKAVHGYPMVVFLDEAETILPNRDCKREIQRWEADNLATFLTEMDGLEESGALLILATNRPNDIDAAMLRDGRCDRKIKIDRPDRRAARAIVVKALTNVPLHDTSVEELADGAVGMMWSDLCRLATIVHGDDAAPMVLGDIVNGAMMVGLVEHAKGIAFRRDLASGKPPTGVGREDMVTAVLSVLKQNVGIEHREAAKEVAERLKAKDHIVEWRKSA